MFLVSKFIYEAMAKSKLHEKTPYLQIHNYEPENHMQTFYRFCYGAPDNKGKVGVPEPVNLKPGTYRSIWSLEGFQLSERVLAVFGHSSELFLRGLELVHSPFIDPGFPGQLQLVVRNFSDQIVLLSPKEIIGKVVFFDISDTILSAVDLMNEIQTNAHNKARQNAIDELGQAMGKIAKS